LLVRMCDTRVTVQLDGEPPVALTGQPAQLLRLVLLWDAGPVSIDLAAHVLNVKTEGMGTYVGLLRDALGDRNDKAIVRTIAGDPRSSPRRPTAFETSLKADCHDFQELVDKALETAGSDWTDHRDLDEGSVAATIPILDKALGVWRGSPAVGFDVAGDRPVNRRRLKDPDVVHTERETLIDLFYQWQKRHVDAVLLRADCTLASDKSKQASVEVLNRVGQLAKQAVPDDRRSGF
jgi:hypothetical protein